MSFFTDKDLASIIMRLALSLCVSSIVLGIVIGWVIWG